MLLIELVSYDYNSFTLIWIVDVELGLHRPP